MALGTGTALYFASPVEPGTALAGTIALLSLSAAAAASWSKKPWPRAALSLLTCLALGFANAKWREMRVAAPIVPRPVITHLSGRVAALDWSRTGLRVVLD